MWLYFKLSPQRKLAELSQRQKVSRLALKQYDGDMAGLYRMIGNDLKISFTHMGLMLLPTLVAIAPVVYVMMGLTAHYPGDLLPWHAEWISDAEMLFLLVMLPVSLLIKFAFRVH